MHLHRPKYNSYNISEKHKILLWTPPKTGSHHNIWVLEDFGFEFWEMTRDKSEIKRHENKIVHSHGVDLLDGHENYQIVCGARHPLKRFFSAFVFSYTHRENYDFSQKNFIEYFIREFYGQHSAWFKGLEFTERKPDYFLRTENLYEDYMKIPFISESEMAKSGRLKEMCNIKRNSFEKENLNAADYYTQDMIDVIYKRYKSYFDLLGYEPIL